MSKPITVLITACGGSIGIDVTKCLRMSDMNLKLIGTETSPYGKMFGNRFCDDVVMTPMAKSDGWHTVINNLCNDRLVDVIIFNHSEEIRQIEKRRMVFETKHIMPLFKHMRRCTDKWKTFEALCEGSMCDMLPKTFLVDDMKKIQAGFDSVGSPVWIRKPQGSGGRGSFLAETSELARAWITCWASAKKEGGKWIFQEFLPGKNVSWQAVYYHGVLIGHSIMERLGYYMGSNIPSGVSGTISHARIIEDNELHSKCCRIVDEITEKRCHGIFTIDLRQDSKGEYRLTEIDCRLAGRPYLHAMAGRNLPKAIVQAILGCHVKTIEPTIEGLAIFRQMDTEPIIIYPDGRER